MGTSGGTLGNDAVTAIVLGSGTAATDYTFGELTPASLAGSVYVDGDNDGVRDGGESGIAGATVELTGTDDLGNPVSSTTTAAADGTYSFTNLRPGDYTITETQPAGYLDGGDAVGTLGGTLGNDTVTDITVTAGANGTGYDFGELATTSLAGSVYHDVDNDGVRDGGEPGIAGVAVDLTGTDDLGASVALATTTNAAGDYSFTNLRPGTYSVVESQPAGYLDGTDVAGSLGGTLGNDTVTDITVDSGDAGTGYDFGELVAAGLAGSVFVDGDNDGVFDVTDTGLAGVTVTLTGTDDLGTPVNVATTTAADGTYDFTGLRPGTYTSPKPTPPATSTASTPQAPSAVSPATTSSRRSPSPPQTPAPATTSQSSTPPHCPVSCSPTPTTTASKTPATPASQPSPSPSPAPTTSALRSTSPPPPPQTAPTTSPTCVPAPTPSPKPTPPATSTASTPQAPQAAPPPTTPSPTSPSPPAKPPPHTPSPN